MSENSVHDMFPVRLKAARQMRGLGQAELAVKAGLPAASISHFEGGSRKPSFDNLRRLAKALNASTDYLLGRVDDIGGSGVASDPLYRHVQNLSGRDREIAEDFLKVLSDKNRNDRGKD